MARIAGDLDQTGSAAIADVSIGALSNLERGKGSSLKTLIAVARALGAYRLARCARPAGDGFATADVARQEEFAAANGCVVR